MKNWSSRAKPKDFWKIGKTKFINTNSEPSNKSNYMPQAIGMIETRGLVALVEGTDAMLKAANVELVGPMMQVGNALVTACVVGDVAADAGAQAIKAIKGEVVSVHVIARPHNDVEAILPKKK
jgi:ethanolamine utilization protein EutM